MKKINITYLLIIYLIIGFISLNPINIQAKELVCNYNFNGNIIEFKVEKDKLYLPFNNGANNFYYGDSFKDSYIASTISNNSQICPSIEIEESEHFTTIFANAKTDKNCNGKCTKLYATNDEKNVVEDIKVGKAIGKYKSDEFIIPVFRKISDGNIEWSLDNKNYSNISDKIKIDNNSYIELEKEIEKNIFTNDEILDKIYRCIFTSNKKLIYRLSMESKSCKKDLSKNDGQGYISKANLGDSGAENCKSTVFGDPENPNSVAWLLQQILNYLKILGPMAILVMSGIDFSKAIVLGDDETMQKCYKKLIKRLVLAVFLFFVPTLVSVFLELFGFVGQPICGLK